MNRILEKLGLRKWSQDEESNLARVLRQNQSEFYKILKKDKLEQLNALDELIRQSQAKTIILKNDILECKVCMDKKIDICLVPCGHCFCEGCLKNTINCYLCNREIFIKQRLYV
jgi:hypothetical protein